jgi:hypothetical protein
MPPAARWVAAALVLLAGCGDEPSADEQRERLADDLVAEVGDDLGRAEAECVAERLHDEFGEEAFEEVLDAADRPSSDDAGRVRSTVVDVFAECGALGAVATTDG